MKAKKRGQKARLKRADRIGGPSSVGGAGTTSVASGAGSGGAAIDDSSVPEVLEVAIGAAASKQPGCRPGAGHNSRGIVGGGLKPGDLFSEVV